MTNKYIANITPLIEPMDQGFLFKIPLSVSRCKQKFSDPDIVLQDNMYLNWARNQAAPNRDQFSFTCNVYRVVRG